MLQCFDLPLIVEISPNNVKLHSRCVGNFNDFSGLILSGKSHFSYFSTIKIIIINMNNYRLVVMRRRLLTYLFLNLKITKTVVFRASDIPITSYVCYYAMNGGRVH